MPTPQYHICCTKNDRIARDVYEIHCEKPDGFTFQAGQFILFDVPLIEDETDIQTRAFSLASSPLEDELIFAMKLVEGGRASRFIEQKLHVGTTLRMQGPFGVFHLDQDTEKEYVLICTSTGNAPFRSQLMTILPSGDTRRIDLIYGVRAKEDLFWKEEFEALAREYDNFYLHIALSQPEETWKGHRGRVQTLVPQIVRDWSQKKVYACGNPDMTGDIKKLCLEEWGVGKEDFHMEGYI